MTQTQARKILETAFAALPKRDRDRLWWHHEQGTPILCGLPKARMMYTANGKP